MYKGVVQLESRTRTTRDNRHNSGGRRLSYSLATENILICSVQSSRGLTSCRANLIGWLTHPRNISQTKSMAGRVRVALLLTNHRRSLPSITFPPMKKWLNPPHSSYLFSNHKRERGQRNTQQREGVGGRGGSQLGKRGISWRTKHVSSKTGAPKISDVRDGERCRFGLNRRLPNLGEGVYLIWPLP